ncbi:uncharacterized protein PHALS_14515 [Plasmopara halstedii]|uniref:Uncharacterized protein n=1 Tax=Plasmopara halstedii TaxID=4781 RepID=A0A0P1AJU9_PLAHL|nr:uncharacterized protein PHALS_14515 [Plasmopara halstedii]CEG41263.1 hypothetical protein PHALS_14515 [Plasmopara halstedii]|eukprot:XP_024577632.1 hypothetical protein PHALS_14515 [Plasmopara halstedii]
MAVESILYLASMLTMYRSMLYHLSRSFQEALKRFRLRTLFICSSNIDWYLESDNLHQSGVLTDQSQQLIC